MSKKLFVPLLIAVLCSAACAPMGRGGPGEGAGRGGPETGLSVGSVTELGQEQLRLTGEALRLNPAQTVFWDRYQEKVGALLADQMKLPSYRARQTAVQQIAGKADVVRNRLSAMEDILDAASALYQALDDRQKKIADEMLAATVPALYSGLGASAGKESGDQPGGRPGGRGGPGGGMGGGLGRMER
ncbi:Spy/CpxP family protein refolding chaperone [Azonexus hydrophilus]|uniref:Spy/CpxP family protein refolding chaperone n=1 Tax=Azonexus hydrophilus TaxID=418702 RepID=UPI000B496B16|nr:Spy/CpxP family protein refolding chaperone [Azonexus hydrophilus]